MLNYYSYEEEFNYVNTPRSGVPSTSGTTSLGTANNSGYCSDTEIVLNTKKNKRVSRDDSNDTNNKRKIYHSKINSPVNKKKKEEHYRSSKKIKHPKTVPYQIRPRSTKPKKSLKSSNALKSPSITSSLATPTSSLATTLESPLSTTFGSSLSLNTLESSSN